MSLQLNRFGKILGKSAKPSEFYAKPPLNYTNFLKSEALRPALDDNTPNQPGDALDAGGPGRYNRLDMPRPMGSAYAFRETLAKRRGRMDGPHRIDRTARIIAAQNRRQRATSMPRGRRHRATLRPALDDDTPCRRSIPSTTPGGPGWTASMPPPDAVRAAPDKRTDEPHRIDRTARINAAQDQRQRATSTRRGDDTGQPFAPPSTTTRRARGIG
ncbi:MAG: hypothetical protein JNK37_14315 [Verrucomicrobiales bacterium]|nr:hypothetical protein [Verrucomicrobiales bacterium]